MSGRKDVRSQAAQAGQVGTSSTDDRVQALQSKIIELERQVAALQEAQGFSMAGEEKFASVVRSSPMGVHLYELRANGDLILIGGNAAADRMTGVTTQDLVGKTIEEAFPRLKGTEIPARYRRAAQAGTPWQTHMFQYHDDRIHGAFDVHVFQTSANQVAVMFLEVTERVLADQAIRASELRYRELFERIPNGVAVYEAVDDGEDFVFRDFNRGGESIERMDRGRVLGRRVTEVFPGVKDFGLLEVFQRVWRTGLSEYFPAAVYRDDRTLGSWRENWVYKLPSGEIVAVYSDLTEQKRAEIERDRLFNHSLDMLCIAGFDGRFKQLNPAWTQVLGWSTEELLARPWLDWTHPEDRQATVEAGERLARGESLFGHENRYLCKDGSYRWVSWNAFPLLEEGSIFAVARDITQAKVAEARLTDYRSRLKGLAAELSLAEQRERRRIAEVVHDGICQRLALAKLEIQSVQQTLADVTAIRALERDCQMLDQIMEEAHQLTFELSNPILHEVGLDAAVESWLNKTIEGRHGIRCEFTASPRGLRPAENLRVVLFQAVRELATNVIKHAKATWLKVVIGQAEGGIQVSVQDNGTGFDTRCLALTDTGGFGLFNVRERLEYLGGGLNIQSSLGQGTTVTAFVPYEDPPAGGNVEGS